MKLNRTSFRRFTLLNGALGMGLTTWVGWCLLMGLMFRGETDFLHAVGRRAVTLPLWVIGGWIWAAALWQWFHRPAGKKPQGFPLDEPGDSDKLP